MKEQKNKNKRIRAHRLQKAIRTATKQTKNIGTQITIAGGLTDLQGTPKVIKQ